MIQFIKEVPEDTDLENINDECKSFFDKYSFQIMDQKVVGTEAINGYEIRLAMANVDPDVLADTFQNYYLTEDEKGEELLVDLDLDWTVLASGTKKVDNDMLALYFAETVIFDEDGEQIGSEPVTNIAGKLQSYAGKKWIY